MYRYFLTLVLLALTVTANVSASPQADTIPDLPIIRFKKNSSHLTTKAKAMLDSIAQLIAAHPEWNIGLGGMAADTTARSIELSWNRVAAVVDYLLIKGISAERLLFVFDICHDPLTVELQIMCEIPPNVPRPHPQRYKKQ
ncbi:OmpA family protein [Foetidibacter luteolus]|uniref:OmpA family protein n=1 Tax=Foetidibacter luteolus TaxID=2608880 RepID=UPI00129AF9D4|nr:OmpA family protein [Foetidibacter luteolus]